MTVFIYLAGGDCVRLKLLHSALKLIITITGSRVKFNFSKASPLTNFDLNCLYGTTVDELTVADVKDIGR